MRIILGVLVFAVLIACSDTEKEKVIPVPGEIQVLNACGMSGAADKMRDYLMENGYDVVETGNAQFWNYKETVIAIRNKYWVGKEAIGMVLNTDNIVLMENRAKLVDATVFIGRDFESLIRKKE